LVLGSIPDIQYHESPVQNRVTRRSVHGGSVIAGTDAPWRDRINSAAGDLHFALRS
jgi:hypothetical protein